jgi:hypothetical protein
MTTLTTGTALSQSVTMSAAQLAVQSFAGNNSSGVPFSALSGGANRYNASNGIAQLSISDSPVSVTFAGSAAGGAFTQYWLSCIHKLLATVPQLNVSGIASGEAFGNAALLVASPQTLTATGVASGEAFGTTLVGPTQFLTPSGITSAEAFGTSTMGLFIPATGIASAEAFGSSTVTRALAPTFDAVGPGATQANGTSVSWSHTATAGADVFVSVRVANQTLIPSVTYGGTAMTSLGSIGLANNVFVGYIQMFRLASAPGGAQTVNVTFDAFTAGAGNSISYTFVTSVGTAATVFGTGTALSQSVTLSAGQAAIQAFAVRNTTMGSLSGGTNRYNANALAINTASATATFAATAAVSAEWAGIAVILS